MAADDTTLSVPGGHRLDSQISGVLTLRFLAAENIIKTEFGQVTPVRLIPETSESESDLPIGEFYEGIVCMVP